MLPISRRLHTAADFKRLRAKGKVWRSPSFTALIMPSRRSPARLGIVVSTKIGKSVKRKRASRILRHAYATQIPAHQALDIVLIARPYILNKTTTQLQQELQKMIKFTQPQGNSD